MKKAYIFITLLLSILAVTTALRPQHDLSNPAQEVVAGYRQNWKNMLVALEKLQAA